MQLNSINNQGHSKKLDLVVSIVVYNSDLEILSNLCEKVLSSSLNLKLVLLDNSEVNYAYHFNNYKHDKRFSYIKTKKNKGFGAGHNIVIKEYANISKYLLFLNPDIVMNDRVLETLFKRMELNEKIGLCIPKILNVDGTIQYVNKKLPQPFDLIFRRIRFFSKYGPSIVQKLMKSYELRDMYDFNAFLCPYISGCFMFCRSEVIQKVLGFDEKFFLYLEETDLARRMMKHADNVVFCDLSVDHVWARGPYDSVKLFLINVRSMCYYFGKWRWFFDQERKKLNAKIGQYNYVSK
jgi:GT2 family glycosyltransferase